MSPHPLLIGWLLKQANFFTFYQAAASYGWHKIYRRLLEANNRLVDKKEDRLIVQDTIKQAMRFPTKVVDILDESHTVAFLQKYAKELTTDLETKAPPFFVNAAKLVLAKTPLGKMTDIFGGWQETQRSRKKGGGEGGEGEEKDKRIK